MLQELESPNAILLPTPEPASPPRSVPSPAHLRQMGAILAGTLRGSWCCIAGNEFPFSLRLLNASNTQRPHELDGHGGKSLCLLCQACKQDAAKVALTEVREHHHDCFPGIFFPLRDPQSSNDSGAGGNAD